MGSLAGLGPALQGIGIAGILVLVLVLVSRGAYITRDSHQEVITAQMAVIAELSREIERLEGELQRLQAILSAKGLGDD